MQEIQTILLEPTVKNGIFKGLKYPNYKSFGSAIYPKILGCYEAELHPVFSKILNTKYSKIIDIGAAEGYYSVGLAKFMNTYVIAVDTNSEALKLLLNIANLNNARNLIQVKDSITNSELSEICNNEKCLIISDCEGYESKLFDSKFVASYSLSDLIIETHENIELGISKKIQSIFNETHEITIIKSIDDIEKFNNYNFKELQNLSNEAKLLCLSENRSYIQEWVYLKAKDSNTP